MILFAFVTRAVIAHFARDRSLKTVIRIPGSRRVPTSGILLLALAGFASAQTPKIAGITDAAPLVPPTGNLARGELISIYGSNLTNGAILASFPPIAPLTLAGTSVNIGGIAAPILYVSPTQLNVQVPFEIAAGVPSVNVTITSGTQTSAAFLMGVTTSDLGLFSAQGVIKPSSANTVVVTAAPGSPVVLSATGLGAISPAVASGTTPTPGLSNALAIPAITMNGALANVLSATYDELGLYTITVAVPAGADTDSVTVVLGGTAGAIGPPSTHGTNRRHRSGRPFRRNGTDRPDGSPGFTRTLPVQQGRPWRGRLRHWCGGRHRHAHAGDELRPRNYL